MIMKHKKEYSIIYVLINIKILFNISINIYKNTLKYIKTSLAYYCLFYYLIYKNSRDN